MSYASREILTRQYYFLHRFHYFPSSLYPSRVAFSAVSPREYFTNFTGAVSGRPRV